MPSRHAGRSFPVWALSVLGAACAGGARPAAPPVATPGPTPASAPPAAATRAPASRFAFLPGTAAYDVRTESTVEMTAGPQAERGKERIATSARVTYELTPAARGGLAVAGQVESISMDAPARIGGLPAPTAPLRFHGVIDGRGVNVELDGATITCATAAGGTQSAALATAREVMLRMPPNVSVASRWRDSVSMLTCRGPIPATVTSVARYEVTGVDGQTVHVRRETTLRLRGHGIAGGRSVTVTGSGDGVATIELDAGAGRLTRIDGESHAMVTVALPDGARQFTQQVRTEVRSR